MDTIERTRLSTQPPFEFLWLELTNRCNLRCVHCYANSGPDAEVNDPLTTAEHEQVLRQAYDAGCTKVQFIGGEPTLNRDLVRLVEHAAAMGYEFIEVYTNLTRLPESFVGCLAAHRVYVATSVYASTAGVHDRITRVPGSFARTIANLRKLVAAGIPVRVGVVEMEENADLLDRTLRFLNDDVGVRHVKVDYRRPFGRGSDGVPSLEGLCGACAGGTLCVGPDGRVSPCIMSKRWAVGSVREEALGDIVLSERLSAVRDSIRRAVPTPSASPHHAQATCQPDIIGCPPLNECGPKINPASDCIPRNQCGPDLPPAARYAAGNCDPSSQCGPVIGCNPLNQCGPQINGIRRNAH